MKILNREDTICPCCMEKHEILTVEVDEYTIFKEIDINFKAVYYYCGNEDSYFEDGNMMNMNDITMKNEYRRLLCQ